MATRDPYTRRWRVPGPAMTIEQVNKCKKLLEELRRITSDHPDRAEISAACDWIADKVYGTTRADHR